MTPFGTVMSQNSSKTVEQRWEGGGGGWLVTRTRGPEHLKTRGVHYTLCFNFACTSLLQRCTEHISFKSVIYLYTRHSLVTYYTNLPTAFCTLVFHLCNVHPHFQCLLYSIILPWCTAGTCVCISGAGPCSLSQVFGVSGSSVQEQQLGTFKYLYRK